LATSRRCLPCPARISAPGCQRSATAESFCRDRYISKIPFVGDGGRKGYQGFLDRDLSRAFAISPKGDWTYRGGENAISEALKACSDKGDCQLYAVDDQVVWHPNEPASRK
jgi:hypothetical protein